MSQQIERGRDQGRCSFPRGIRICLRFDGFSGNHSELLVVLVGGRHHQPVSAGAELWQTPHSSESSGLLRLRAGVGGEGAGAAGRWKRRKCSLVSGEGRSPLPGSEPNLAVLRFHFQEGLCPPQPSHPPPGLRPLSHASPTGHAFTGTFKP